MEKLLLNPSEITNEFVKIGEKKTNLPAIRMFVLGILAGAFIAFAAEGSSVAIHTIESVGLAKALAGALFSTGLMMVVIAGGELFTGNSLIIVSCMEKKSSWKGLLKNWFWVYVGNFVGSFIIALFIYHSGQLSFSGGLLGATAIKTAAYKTNLTFENAFFMGIMCNWLVCLAVWMAAGAKDIGGKILAIFFPIWLFITSGFEHSVANMYYITVGLFAKANQTLFDKALEIGVSLKDLNSLTWVSLVTKNLIPVTLGNIVGGVLFVGITYWFIYLYRRSDIGNGIQK